MAIPIQHYGVYRFINYAYNNGQALNAYGSTSIPLKNTSNVNLYTKEMGDKAQEWRAMYAGIDGNRKLYWLNCVMGGSLNPFALDRLMSGLKNNADVYTAWESSAADQLVYFTESSSGRVYIHLYGVNATDNNLSDLVLTAAPNASGVNGNNSPSSLTQAGNVYWAAYSGSKAQQWVVEEVSAGAEPNFDDMVTKFPAAYYYTHSHNLYYPDNVGECTWYCFGRFYEVNKIAISTTTANAAKWVNIYDTSTCYCDMTLSAKSVAVFGANSAGDAGHVVFIERVNGTNITYSQCNYGFDLANFDWSNGEIEVPNSCIPNATDGISETKSESDFIKRFGPVKGVIHKR